jgi:serine/threonine protein kinase
MTECKGSPMYSDPLLYGQNTEYKFEWDIYSFGLIMLQLLTGKFLI